MKRAWLVQRTRDSSWEIVFYEVDTHGDFYEIREIAWVEVEEGEPS